MSKNILITGASGMVGEALIKSLSKQGHNLNILTTQKNRVQSNVKCNIYYWNPINNEINPDSLDGIEYIINLAGSPITQRWTKFTKKKIINSRVQSLSILLKTIRENKLTSVKQLISASAIGIYPSSITKYYDENYNQFDNSSFLSSVVKKWESAAMEYSSEGIKVSILRIGIVLGLNGGALPKIIKPIKMYSGAVLSNGNQWQSWIHIEDLISIFRHLLEIKVIGIFNAVAPNPVRQSELTFEIAKLTKRPILLPNIHKSLLKLVFGEMCSIVVDSQRVCSKKIKNTGFNFKFQYIHPALKSLIHSN